MTPTMPTAGLAAVEARMTAIQAQLGHLTATGRGGAPGATFALPATDAPPAADLRLASDTRLPAADRSAAGSGLTATAGAAAESGLSAGLPAHAQKWIPAIERAADAVDLDPTLLAAVVAHESDFDQSAVSHAGAIGLAQLMPRTAEALGVDPHDPQQNLDGGARFLAEQLDRFGSPDLALAAYNAGPSRVLQAGGIPRIPETLTYVDRVLETWEQLR